MCNTVAVTRARWTTETTPLPPHALAWLSRRVGLGEPLPEVPVEAPAPALSADAFTALEAVCAVSVEPSDRLGRAGGLSYLDLLRHRGHGSLAVPDAVVLPASPAEVVEVLQVCVEHDIAVVPFGGGTSVVGGVEALRGSKSAVVALDLAGLEALVSLDPVSRVAVLQAGLTGPEAERLLGEHGFTLGHVPQSFERATIGGFAATRSAGQASSGYGRFEDLVESVRVATPVGEWVVGAAPASAAGPDLKQLVLGSEGLFGVITEVSVRVRPKPYGSRYEGFVVDGWEAGVELVRTLAQDGALADVTRLSDVDETEVALALAGPRADVVRKYLRLRGVRQPCLVILGWECRSRSATMSSLSGKKVVRLGRAMGASWLHGRFNGPRQRDALLDAGVCVETLETATRWSGVSQMRDAVRAALVAELGSPVVMCHISHAYETGASLYFTVLVPRDLADPVGQWERAKVAASGAISRLGTITHHHAVGRDHLPWLEGEIGTIGVDVLRAVKARLDPTGILNPGKLV
ncbi:alkyldihydroxyacetonephosphate synthase [Lentzea xinjiangensis]|uniref:Alkyldihydroxyacetonephosphate synthase n=1 Tax=Lentzea xinjiangensis TaxID=402600 RepID=A0A1H9E8U3_9PSEU|nr:FAD-binding oxidoreductase [Lentzea xinjiangensis]SEQ22174.1 alkyldihydroxyacetonephosphate synthase [Lentzea xinjiangensis]